METTTNPIAEVIETETCSRCAGTGHHSYCQSHGTVCFKCGGAKVVYTKKGAAAAAFLKTLRSKRAADFKVGELIYVDAGPFNKGGFAEVTASEPDAYNKGYWSIGNSRCGMSGSPDTMYRMGLTAEQKADTMRQALAFQATLTKKGTPRKVKAA